ncbi:MAG: glycosyltransferase family 2 protein, partial [Pseudomonadota bacterium]
SSNSSSDIPLMEESEIREKYKARYAAKLCTQGSAASAGSGKVSVILPVWNNARLTQRCLMSIAGNTQYPDYEVIIIDNCSTDATPDLLKGLSGDVRVITNSENFGFARACNQGADAAQGEYLLFLNNDTEVQPGWMEHLAEILSSDPQVAAAGSRLLYPDGTIQHAGIIIVDDRGTGDPLLAENIYRGLPGNIPDAHRMKTFQALTAACLMVRKSCFMQAGLFFEGFRNGYEDVDLCFKLRRRRWRLVYQPLSVVIHHESKSGTERFARAKDNIGLLHGRWRGRVRPDFIRDADSTITPGSSDGIQVYSIPESGLSEQYSFDVSIIIPAYNQAHHTLACIGSIARHTACAHEIIVIDNASSDNTPGLLHALGNPALTVIANQENRGFAIACNQGIRAARGRHIVLLNNDTLVTQGWLTSLMAAAQHSPDIGMAGPVTNYVSNMVQFNGPAPYSGMSSMEAHADSVRREHRGAFTYVDRLVFFCVFIKRSLLDSIGLLDEEFAVGNYEDDDFCWRARRAGFSMIVAHDVFIHHFGSTTFAAHAHELNHDRQMHINGSRFFSTWGIDPAWYEHFACRPDFRLLAATELSPFASADIMSSREEASSRGAAARICPEGAHDSISAQERYKISVVIATYNRSKILRKNLEALSCQNFPADDFEVIVCDDGSHDDTESMVRSFPAPYTCVYLRQENRGPAAARNRALRTAAGKYVLFLDDDTYPIPDALALHYQTHQQHCDEKIAVLGKVATLPEYTQSPVGYILEHSDLLLAFPHMTSGTMYDHNYFFSGNISLLRHAVVAAGMFDEDFTGMLWGAEDIELGYRLHQLGYRVLYVQGALAWHDQNNTIESFCRKYVVRGGGAVRIFLKYPELFYHYRGITLEIVQQWLGYSTPLEAKIQKLIGELKKINASLLPNQSRDWPLFSDDTIKWVFKDQWKLSLQGMLKAVALLTAKVKKLNRIVEEHKQATSLQEVGLHLYPALNFLKWHYDTIGVMTSPWIEKLIDSSLQARRSESADREAKKMMHNTEPDCAVHVSAL